MTRKQKRLAIIGGGLTFIAAAVLLVMFALQQQIVFFNMPSDIAAHPVGVDRRIRLGGLVEAGTVKRGEGSTEVKNMVREWHIQEGRHLRMKY